MRVTSKGQVTIPVAIREALGLLPDTEVEFAVEGDTAVIRKKQRPRRGAGRGKEIVEQLRGRAIVNRIWGSATSGMTTDEIMALMRGR